MSKSKNSIHNPPASEPETTPAEDAELQVEITWTPGASEALKSLQARGLVASAATEKRRWNAALKRAARECASHVTPRGDTARWAQAHKNTPWSLDASFVCDDEMRELNARFRSKDRPTDVLSFSQAESAPLPPDLAEMQGQPGQDDSEGADEDGQDGEDFAWPTSFGDSPGAVGVAPLGDLVIAVETAQRQANERAHDGTTEVLFLSIHGTLHLLGYDHQTSAQRVAMWRAQEALFESLRAQ